MYASPGTAIEDHPEGSTAFVQKFAGGDNMNFHVPSRLMTGFATPVVTEGRGTISGLGHTELPMTALQRKATNKNP
jgi:hypothetical protein